MLPQGIPRPKWDVSDHLAVYVRRKKKRVHSKNIKFIGRSYTNFVREDFQEQLIDASWQNFYASRDPNECWDIMENIFRVTLNGMCPQKEFKVKEVREPWVTNELLEEIKFNDKDNLLRTAKLSGRAEEWTFARRERNRVGKLVKNAKAEFVKEQQRELKSEPKKFWKYISTIMPGKKHSQGTINLTNETTRAEVQDTEVANYINLFFSSIGANLARKTNKRLKFHGETLGAECPMLSTDYEKVLNLCKEINTSKSSGIADIASKIFKHAFMVLIPQLVYLNNSVPTRRKDAPRGIR